jgi:dTDP-4-dehydrorhamnose reductase
MITVAVVGANGQLGTDLVRVLREQRDYAACALTHDHIEVTDPDSVRTALARVRPQVVVHCAAFHRVDECEDRPEEAMRTNALGALHVARTCAGLDALCVYISTDFVFGGQGQGPYSERDAPCPVNVYGVSKLAGEHLVAQACPRWLTVRVASLFGTAQPRAKKQNFVEAVLGRARSGEVLRVVNDIRTSPTYTYDAARALECLIREEIHGLVHVTNTGSCTWYEFAVRIVACAGLTANVVPITSSEFPQRARRPSDSSMHSVRITDPIRRCLRPWTEALEAYLAERERVAGSESPGSLHRTIL